MIATLTLSMLLLGAQPAPSALQFVQDEPRATTAPARRPPRRRPPRRRTPPAEAEGPVLPLPAPPVIAPRTDIAPMPNRSIEGPRTPSEPATTTLRPDLIEPRSLPDARTQSGNNGLTERQDRLYREPAAGARLNIPFSY